ncbi:MAG: ferric reductase-like transmembrane domain-containing protein [Pseudomonadota bacterium]
MSKWRAALIWSALAIAIGVPSVAAGLSPQLAWRDGVYILAGFSGVIALSLLLLQPLLIGNFLPGLQGRLGRVGHKWVGGGLVVAVIVHVGALWITSPPDVIDALLFVSPTQFSIWGVIAMWTVFAAALLATVRKRLGLRLMTWRVVHTALAIVTVGGTVAHAMLIEGTMETLSKAALCALVILATLMVVKQLRTKIRAQSIRDRREA